MSFGKSTTGIYFVKRMPQFEIISQLNRIAEIKLLQIILDNATVERKNTFYIDLAARERLGRQCKVSERTVANALSKMSRPIENGGLEIFVRLGRGRYRLNPYYYFIGDQMAHNDAVESFNALRSARKKEQAEKKVKLKKKDGRTQRKTSTGIVLKSISGSSS